MEKLYPYAVAKVRVKEKNLLTNATLAQMAEETSTQRILATLQEYQYEVESGNIEQILKQEREKLYALIKELADEEKFMDVFLIKNDYHNIKTILKSNIMNQDPTLYLLHGGIVEVEKLMDCIQKQEYSTIPEQMEKALKEAVREYEQTQNGQIIDLVLDKANFEQMKGMAEQIHNDFLIQYVVKTIDFTNLKTFLRMLALHYPFETFQKAYIHHGTIAIETFAKAFQMTEPETIILEQTGYEDLIKKFEQVGNKDKVCDDAIMDYVKKAKQEALTIEPLIAYLYAKETELKNVRIVLNGKINNIHPNQIKERLREAYV